MKKISLALVIVIMLVLSACCIQSQPDFVLVNDFPEKYVKQDDKISFDTEIIIDESAEKELYKCTAQKATFQGGEIAEILFGDHRFEANGDNYISENGESVYVGDAFISYNSNSTIQNEIGSGFSLFKENYTADRFEFANIDDGIALDDQKQVEEYIFEIGINNCSFYRYYLLNQEEGSEAAKYWLGTEKFQGLPVYCSLFAKEADDTWAPIQVMSVSNGIEKIQVLYYFTFDKSDEEIKLRTFKDIADSLEKEYENLLTDNKYLVTNARLIYWVDINQTDSEFDMIPTWVVTVREFTGNDQSEYQEYKELINAGTAESIQVGG